MTLVDAALESAAGMKASIDNAAIACPVLVALPVSLTKSTTSRPERGAIERAGENADDQAQAVAFVIADRQQMAFVGALGIGQRLAVAIDHPADRHRLAALRLEPHLAVGGDGRRHVEHDRRLSCAGTATAIGLVPSRLSLPPHGGKWLLLPTAK